MSGHVCNIQVREGETLLQDAKHVFTAQLQELVTKEASRL